MSDSGGPPEDRGAPVRVRKRYLRPGDEPVSLWNVPNLITIVRLLLTPVFLILLLADTGADGAGRIVAGILFIVLIASDFVDGMIARRNNLVTDFGKIADPIADKALVGGALVGLSILGELWWWVTIVILVREVGITIWRFASLGDRVIPAGPLGKIKTWAQAVAISVLLIPLQHLLGDGYLWLGWVLMAVALLLTVVSGVEYLLSALRVTRLERHAARAADGA